jgi:hypothetical protein
MSDGPLDPGPHIRREFLVISIRENRVLYHKGVGRAATPTVAAAWLIRIEVARPAEEFRLKFQDKATRKPQ